jgi:hypothetical protein
MTLPSSGNQIAMSQINTELGRSSNASISLDTAENGGYVAINPYSPSRPSSGNPAAMSEWWSYNQNATTTTTTTTVACYNLGTINYYPNGSLGANCCFFGSTATLYSNCSSLGLNCIIYQSSNCTSPVDGWVLTDFSNAYFTNASWQSPQGQINSVQGCLC